MCLCNSTLVRNSRTVTLRNLTGNMFCFKNSTIWRSLYPYPWTVLLNRMLVVTIIDNRYGCHQMWPIMTRLTPMKEKWCKLESPIKLELLQTTLSVLSVSTLAACVTLSIIALNRNLQKQFDAVIMCLILWESIDAASYAISIWDYGLISLSIIYIKLFVYKRWLSFLHWIDGH